MTALLASVATLAEAEIALEAGADVIDLKDPAAGALGAWPHEAVRAAVARIGGRRLVSATIGDLPMQPATLTRAAERMAATGVGVVKIGFFPDPGALGACIDALADLSGRGMRLVAVLFGDRLPSRGGKGVEALPPLDLVERLAGAGFWGAMLDTADKATGTLRDHLSDEALVAFVAHVRGLGLKAGLAGSLRIADVAPLRVAGPDYLGFRGALCRAGRRGAALDPAALRAVLAAVREDQEAWQSSATATAGAQFAAHSPSAFAPETRTAKSR